MGKRGFQSIYFSCTELQKHRYLKSDIIFYCTYHVLFTKAVVLFQFGFAIVPVNPKPSLQE